MSDCPAYVMVDGAVFGCEQTHPHQVHANTTVPVRWAHEVKR